MRNASTTAALDVDALLGELTLEEKARLLEGVDSWYTTPIERLGIPSLLLTDGPHGVRKVRDIGGGFDIADNAPSTSFPTASAVAASWDPENARRIGEAIGVECGWHGVDVLLAPGVNIMRDPRCGRNFEYFSEDPLVAGAFGAAFVQGVEAQGIGTSVKHFAANSNEEYRFVGDSVVDERALREVYLRAFERVVTEASPATVMCAYNKLNGTFCSENRDLLTGILRDEWGFTGVVMTDWGATHDRVAGIAAGLDLDMPGGVPHNRAAIVAAVEDGSLAADTVDAAVRNVLTLISGRTSHGESASAPDLETHAALATQVALDSAVLLRNDGTLPLPPDRRIAVVGEMFERLRFQGAGSSLVTPTTVTSARDAFDRRGIRYAYARGYRSLDATPDPALAAAAVAAARDAEVVLFFGGLGDLEESEGFDRPHLRLSDAQASLLRELVGTGVPVVLVLHAGSAVEVPVVDELAAVLHMHLPGMHGGEAAAALLFGEACPSGKLAQSWPRTAEDASDFADYNRGPMARYYESIYVGYRFYDKAGTDLLFPFGHGLSYANFSYDDVTVRVHDGRAEAAVTVTNTGEVDAAEVVQLYVRNNSDGVFKAEKELRAFAKVRIRAGETVVVPLSFALSDLSYWDVAEHGWVLDNGEYEILIAASAADIRLRAPLTVTTGRNARSPYPPEVDRAYSTPPRSVPECFPKLVGAPMAVPDTGRRLTMETRLKDARRSPVGALLHRAIVGRARKEFEAARRLPESFERDTRLKNAHFLLRMMPTATLRSLVMSSNGQLPYEVAAGIADLAAWHPVRGLKKILSKRR